MTTRAIACKHFRKYSLRLQEHHTTQRVLETLSGQLDDRERSFLMEIVYGFSGTGTTLTGYWQIPG